MNLENIVICTLLAINSAFTGLLLFFVKDIYTDFKAWRAKQVDQGEKLARHDERIKALEQSDD